MEHLYTKRPGRLPEPEEYLHDLLRQEALCIRWRNAKGTIKPFEALYCSIDNGLSWTKETRNIIFPQKVSDSNPNLKPFTQYYTEGEGTYSCAVDEDSFIWIIWEDGSICRGRINRLGFASKW